MVELALEGVGDVHRVRSVRRPGHRHPAHAAPRLQAGLDLVPEDPPVAGVANRVQGGQAQEIFHTGPQ